MYAVPITHDGCKELKYLVTEDVAAEDRSIAELLSYTTEFNVNSFRSRRVSDKTEDCRMDRTLGLCITRLVSAGLTSLFSYCIIKLKNISLK